jgi:hypothetical protein
MLLDEEHIAVALRSHYSQICQHSASRLETHNSLTKEVADLANEFGLQASCEYLVPQLRDDNKKQFTDVIWLSKTKPIAVFEVDSSLRAKSIRKLQAIPAQFKFWVYYGQKDPVSFLNEVAPSSEIIIIQLHRTSKNETTSHPQQASSAVTAITSSQQMTAVFEVDRHIRQAIQHCWSALPEEERSLERVKQELTRLTQRAVEDVEEDILTFGERKTKPTDDSQIVQIQVKHPRAYTKWTEEDEKLLKRKYSDGASIRELSKLLQRQPGAIRSRLRKLGAR